MATFTVTFHDGTAATYVNGPAERNEFTIEPNGVLVSTSWSGVETPGGQEPARRRVQYSSGAWLSVEDELETLRPPEHLHE